MDRSILYTQENTRGYDVVMGFQDVLKAAGKQASDILGQTITVATGLAATQSSPTSLTINIGVGALYQSAILDPTAVGDLPIDGGTYYIQGVAWSSQTLTLSTSALASGQSQWVLVQATFGFSDVIRSGDPTGGVLPFFNAANPQVPLQGQGGSGATLNTERLATLSLSLVYGTPATTGSQVPPDAATGNVGLYLILLTYGQTTITTAEILTAGPSVGTGVPSNYPYAPFLAGLLNQHHKGIPGQAPKIDLTQEVQGILPSANYQVSGSFTATLSGPFAASITGTIKYTLTGNIVTLYADADITGTATTATQLTIGGIPTNLTPASPTIRFVHIGLGALLSNNVSYSGIGTVEVGQIVVSLLGVSSSDIVSQQFSATGTDGIAAGFTVSYPIA